MLFIKDCFHMKAMAMEFKRTALIMESPPLHMRITGKTDMNSVQDVSVEKRYPERMIKHSNVEGNICDAQTSIQRN